MGTENNASIWFNQWIRRYTIFTQNLYIPLSSIIPCYQLMLSPKRCITYIAFHHSGRLPFDLRTGCWPVVRVGKGREAARSGEQSCIGTMLGHHAWAPCIGTVYRLIAVRIRWIRIPGWSAFTLGSAICVKRIALPRRQRTSHNHNSIFCAVFVCACSIKGNVRRYYSTWL